MKRPARRQGILAVLPLVVAVLACTDIAGKIAAPGDNPVGTWVARSVNGQSLPVALYSAGGNTTALSDDILVIRFDHTYVETSVTRTARSGTSVASAPPDSTINVGGWYLTSGDLTVGVAPASVSGNTLTVTWSSAMTATYQKQ